MTSMKIETYQTVRDKSSRKICALSLSVFVFVFLNLSCVNNVQGLPYQSLQILNSITSGNSTAYMLASSISSPDKAQGNAAYISGVITMSVKLVGESDELTKYNKKYAVGKYRTVVTVYEGSIVLADYDDEKGPDYKKAKAVGGGQKVEIEGEIKG